MKRFFAWLLAGPPPALPDSLKVSAVLVVDCATCGAGLALRQSGFDTAALVDMTLKETCRCDCGSQTLRILVNPRRTGPLGALGSP